jgi:hypothetical protein
VVYWNDTWGSGMKHIVWVNVAIGVGGGAVLFGVELALFRYVPWTDDLAGALGVCVTVTLNSVFQGWRRLRAARAAALERASSAPPTPLP